MIRILIHTGWSWSSVGSMGLADEDCLAGEENVAKYIANEATYAARARDLTVVVEIVPVVPLLN